MVALLGEVRVISTGSDLEVHREKISNQRFYSSSCTSFLFECYTFMLKRLEEYLVILSRSFFFTRYENCIMIIIKVKYSRNLGIWRFVLTRFLHTSSGTADCGVLTSAFVCPFRNISLFRHFVLIMLYLIAIFK